MALTPSGFWDGLDGNWSTFKLSLGPVDKPSSWQSFHVLVSTSSHQIRVPFSSYCNALDNPWGPDCGRLRGVRDFQGIPSNGFEPSESETWNATTREDMCIFAFDAGEIDHRTRWSVAPGEFFHGGRTLKIEEADPAKGDLLGSFGMSAIAGSTWFWMPDALRFTMSSVAQAGFLQALTFETILPAAYGYTAGAAYQNAAASLTIGYYNSSLLLPGARSFAFSRDHDLKVHLASIQASETPRKRQNSILAKDISVVLDSSEPYLQFPEVICRAFQNAFGLEYELETGLFLVNSSTRARLRELNPVLTFTLTGGVEEDGSISSDMEVVLPYSSFDLEFQTAPHTHPRAYFPLKIAADDSFGVLGRAFFQEAYLIVNYPYNNFTISQRSFAPVGSPGPNLTRIHAEVGSSLDGPFPLIVVGILLLVGILGSIVLIPWFLFYTLPGVVISALFDKPRARRMEKRQKELEKLWGKIHGD